MTIEVVLATHNQHKVGEFQRILGAAMPELIVVAYDGPEPVEDGISFADNALIKARTAAAHTGRIALADDSGISVDLLGGAPGIFSARWAGPKAGDRANLELLLAQLADIAPEHRAASFRCTIALVVPEGLPHAGFEHVSEGIWRGRLATAPSGENGFGYDPIFVPEGYDVSAAELPPETKNEISHRARAFGDLIPTLRTLV
ncbi:RdgB/HAM1 family non-canonical purine NTP pyrophosphatase [Mycetocola manganoxydans]|uniref:dITP/XTP pyrophosphatase n=1 Tax=Mycetocola manganoxydans TaxID=699879 RepID=A0A3L6ZSD2_9MICO|nr:RdgB/HAM1 family non-canonical purine NTP pyrophosphatase [Mycetocola manganoxydans]RLP70758.1 RdgB/HAM1 family non-canonical purine NTP pyrophosphatase [Mycetocola manganoxydans]GHD48493.1 non-canonical purine NTP pyrophosphatase [Mycetocola manganoxydans]